MKRNDSIVCLVFFDRDEQEKLSCQSITQLNTTNDHWFSQLLLEIGLEVEWRSAV